MPHISAASKLQVQLWPINASVYVKSGVNESRVMNLDPLHVIADPRPSNINPVISFGSFGPVMALNVTMTRDEG